ncbi:MAG: glycoside hydrolase family 9 protein [Kiritimatiellia bacterium]
MPPELRVLHTQLGYRNRHGKKTVIVPDTPAIQGMFGVPLFSVVEHGAFSRTPLNSPAKHRFVFDGPLQRVSGDFGTWWEGDFSDIHENGVYQIFCGGKRGPLFVIRDDVWIRLLPLCLTYFRVQSCGRNVPGWHEACHLDDALVEKEKRYIDAPGGWHDAGDFRQHATSTSMNALSLLLAHRMWSGREEELGVEPGVFLEEARRGVHFFLALQRENGSLFRAVGDGGNETNRYTDNIRESGDERTADPRPANPPGKFTVLYALYAEALKTEDPDLSGRCLSAAELSMKHDCSLEAGAAEWLQWKAWAYLELWKLTGKEELQHGAAGTMRSLLDLQVKDYIGGQSVTRGFFMEAPGAGVSGHKHIGSDYVIWILAEFLKMWPDHPDSARWKDAIAMWADDYVLAFAARNPFGLLPYAFYTSPPEEHAGCLYRRLGEDLWFRYFLADNTFGVNARSALSAAALAAASRVLSRPELMDHGYRLLEWILGANPFQLSTMSGAGVRQACAHSSYMGDIPGGVMNGIGGDNRDMPSPAAHPWSGHWNLAEYYGYNTSQFMWAMLALQDLEWKSPGQGGK